jgi:hypothetical protein
MFQAFKDLNRLREIAALAIRHGFGGVGDPDTVAAPGHAR